MNWLSNLPLLWGLIIAFDYSWGSMYQRQLSLVAHAKCTYSYEVTVHTTRGSHSTESDGFQVHGLVSLHFDYWSVYSLKFCIQLIAAFHFLLIQGSSFTFVCVCVCVFFLMQPLAIINWFNPTVYQSLPLAFALLLNFGLFQHLHYFPVGNPVPPPSLPHDIFSPLSNFSL